MAVLPRTHIPPSRKVWSIVEMLKARHDMTDEQLAGTARVSVRTVRSDRANPGGIPLERIIRYLGIEINGNNFVSAIEREIADKEDTL